VGWHGDGVRTGGLQVPGDDVSPDGRRLVLVRAVESDRPDQVSVLLNPLPRR
jgi:hypothetical protein